MKLIDLTGKQFGRLTVIKRNEQNDSTNHPLWVCQCECGNIKIVSGSHLKSGHTISCGCYHKEIAGLNNFIDMTGKKINKLTVIRQLPSNKQGNAIWECQCECGNIINVKGIELRNGHIQSCGCAKSKGEEKISRILRENNIQFEQQKTFDTCRFPDTNALARFDFYLPKQNILIEYDGSQHFYDKGWESLEIVQYRDNYKNQWCKENNIPLIRIPYTQFDNLCIEDIYIDKTKYRVV